MPREGARDPLVVRSIDFLGGLTLAGGFQPDGALPEVAIAGRSNSGKSSLINNLVRRKKIARTSRTPGRTREINFFDVNGRFVLADLPGYGYAKVSAEARATWRPLIERYIRNNRALRGVVLLFDVRRDPSPDDLDMIDLLGEVEVPVLAVVTKVDKLSAARASERIQAVRRTLGIDAEQVVPYSSVTGEGRDELATAILAIVGEAGS